MKSNKKNNRNKYQRTKKKIFRTKTSSHLSQKGGADSGGAGAATAVGEELEAHCVNVMNVLEEDATNKTKYETGTIIIPPPTPNKPAINPEKSPVNKNVIIKINN